MLARQVVSPLVERAFLFCNHEDGGGGNMVSVVSLGNSSMSSMSSAVTVVVQHLKRPQFDGAQGNIALCFSLFILAIPSAIATAS